MLNIISLSMRCPDITFISPTLVHLGSERAIFAIGSGVVLYPLPHFLISKCPCFSLL